MITSMEQARRIIISPLLVLVMSIATANAYCQSLKGEEENEYYRISDVPIPEAFVLEVGGLAFDNLGNLGVVTRRGDLWLISNPTSANPTYTRFAHGLHEPLGLAFSDGSFYLTQRAEQSIGSRSGW